ncbi:hypothetical protein E4U39_006359 [Claviceps sp. Clav50 group G5]|nr:hypothetical protein E4U39_006359 [Claviceps sp. Clav50 group G5]
MSSTLSLSAEHGSYLQGLHHNSNAAHANVWNSSSPARDAASSYTPFHLSPDRQQLGLNAVDVDSGVYKWPAVPPPCHTAPDTPDFLERIERALRIDDADVAAPLPCKTAPVRGSSSSYPSVGQNTPRVRSPVSEHNGGNRLSFSGLSKFGRANDNLSNLQSNSPTSAASAVEGVGDISHHELVADTAAAITEWQDASKPFRKLPYNNYELAESSELFPSDSLSQQGNVSPSPSTRPPIPPSRVVPEGRRATTSTTTTATPTSSIEALDSLGHQYDGILEARRKRTSEIKYRPAAPALGGTSHPLTSSKRKASTFSLRSLTRSLKKKRRLTAIRHWASKVYQRSSLRLTEAYRKLKSHHPMRHASFSGPWDRQQKQQPAIQARDTNDDKARGSNAVFGFERQRRSEDWWEDGVSRYRAPSGMFTK